MHFIVPWALCLKVVQKGMRSSRFEIPSVFFCTNFGQVKKSQGCLFSFFLPVMPCFKNTVIESTNLLLFYIELISQAGIKLLCAFGRQITKERLDTHLACLNIVLLKNSFKYDSVLSRNVKIRYFLSRNVKIRAMSRKNGINYATS